jgi:phosphoglycolate phosphatase-like HAD superfamily hydrolase
MADHIEKLKGLKKEKEFFVGIDSDGCAFDTMEVKHKECFIPNIINSWDLQAVSRMAREAAEFVNLYSQWRGINRFPALTMVFDLLAERSEALERGYKAPQVDSLRDWIERETRLSSATLTLEVKRTKDPVLKKALAWSDAVNQTVAKTVRGVPPFPHVRESIEKLKDRADIMVVSATPGEALRREWNEHDIAKYTKMICGQEMGSKKEHIQYGAVGKYDGEKILMVGDAPGDMKAAKSNNALFFPVNPGDESSSWKRFYEDGIDKFLAGQYAGDYEQKLIDEFMRYLPSTPPWKKSGQA